MAEEIQGEKAEQKPVEPAKKEEATQKIDVEKKIEPAQAGEEKKAAPAAPAKVERPANCVVCNKSIKLRKRWYYRNGKYYCTKRCWKTAVKKEEEKPREAKESGQS